MVLVSGYYLKKVVFCYYIITNTMTKYSNSKKIKILVTTDASFLASGYGIYAKEILTRLHNSGKYEVAELACYATVNSKEIKKIPWKVYPNAVISTDPRFADYKKNNINQFGAWRFNRVLLDFQPDIVATWTDYWMYSYQEISPLRPYFKWLQMPMIDSAPQKTEWLYTYAGSDMVLPYTEWAKKTLLESCNSQIKLFPNVANAGINTNEFYPISNKKEHQKSWFGKEFDIVGSVMRNQKRKLFGDLFLSYRQYLNKLIDNHHIEKYNNSILYVHTSYPEESGWDLPSLLLEYNLLDKTYFSYICKNCNSFIPSKFKGAIVECPNCKTANLALPSVTSSVDNNILNQIYNFFDFYIQYAIAEGFGMPTVEAAACGVPLAAVDYSAMTEIMNNVSGIKIPVIRMFRELESNALRAYPDNTFTSDMLYNFFIELSDEHKANWSKNISTKCTNIYTWDKVYETWDSCIQSIDLTSKTDWSAPASKTNHENMSVPGNLNPKQFIEYVCNHIINSPYLVNTATMQTIIRDLTNKIIAKNNMIQHFDHKQAIEILDNYLANKIIHEKARVNPSILKDEDFLNCQK